MHLSGPARAELGFDMTAKPLLRPSASKDGGAERGLRVEAHACLSASCCWPIIC